MRYHSASVTGLEKQMTMEFLTASDSIVSIATGLLHKAMIQALLAHKMPP